MTLMTLKEVALEARVSESTIRRWVRSAELPAYRLGRQLRIRPDEFERFLDRRRVDPTPNQPPRQSHTPKTSPMAKQ